jgi:hypothetical protein
MGTPNFIRVLHNSSPSSGLVSCLLRKVVNIRAATILFHLVLMVLVDSKDGSLHDYFLHCATTWKDIGVHDPHCDFIETAYLVQKL